MALLGITLLAGAAFVGGYLYRRGLDRRRYRFIQQFRLPPRVAQAVRERYPQLSEEQVQRVLGGLREYLLLCRAAGKRMVAMPSQVVDVAWHELILHTRLYQHVCRKGLGRFLHHTPAQAMRSPRQPRRASSAPGSWPAPRGHRPTESHAPTAAVRPRHGTGDRRRLPLRPELCAAARRRRSGVLRQPYRLQQRLRQR
ncbi:Uncharacterized conserved protein [Pseudomonas aeruginosa]|nr:Uncharacterized conserved protein [Pseudomonas aeruginosa]